MAESGRGEVDSGNALTWTRAAASRDGPSMRLPQVQEPVVALTAFHRPPAGPGTAQEAVSPDA